MRYYKNLTVDEYCRSLDICAKIEDGIAVYNVYAVCAVQNNGRLFEIYDTKNLLGKYSNKEICGIIAFVYGKKAAVEFVRHMLDDWVDGHGSLDGIKEFYIDGCK